MALVGLRGLYAVTDAALCAAHGGVVAAVELALAGGARLVQFRDRSTDHAARSALARALVAACHARGALLIVNDDVELAAIAAADGVHLGRDDAALAAARARLGSRAVLGASCYASLDRARAATAAGADYLAFGSIYPSPTKPAAPRAALELLGAARRELGLPVCAIGGIAPAQARAVIAAGADLIAVVSGVFGAADPAAAARGYAAAFAD